MPTTAGFQRDNSASATNAVGALVITTNPSGTVPTLSGTFAVSATPTNSAGVALTPTNASGSTAAGAQITATITPGATQFAYISGFTISLGVGTAGTVTATVTGVNGGPLNYAVSTSASVTDTYNFTFSPMLISTAVNTAIVVTVPAVGGVAAVNSVTATGFIG
jgi:hypothetical protein